MITNQTHNGAVVDVHHLTRQFGDKRALDEVSVQVPRGEVFGIVGRNGAGKTTLIKHILGLYRAQSGSVRVFGRDPVADPEGVLAKIGYLSEDPDMPAWMRVSELLNYTAAFYASWDRAYATELIEMFGIDPANRVRGLSKGMRAQVGLCIAQAHRPDLLLLDEPSSGLDPSVRRDILSAIIRTVVDEGRTVIFSSHLLDEVERVSDRLMMLKEGQIMLCDPMEKVLSSHHRLTVRSEDRPAFDRDIPGLLQCERQGDEWLVDFYGDMEETSALLERSGRTILAHRVLSLNDVFHIRSEKGALH